MDELARELGGGRAGVDDDRGAVGDELRGGTGDCALGLLLLARPQRVLRLDPAQGDGAAVLAADDAGLGEPGQVAPDRHLGDPEPVGQVGHPDRAGLAGQVGDRPQAVGAEHSPPALAMAAHLVHTKSIMIGILAARENDRSNVLPMP